MEKKTVPVAIALSVGTGIAFSTKFGPIHELIEWMAGEPVWTHQLPRVGRECEAWLKEQDPRIAALDTASVNRANWKERLKEIEEQWGADYTVSRLPAERHERCDPISEATELFGSPPIVLIGPSDEP